MSDESPSIGFIPEKWFNQNEHWIEELKKELTDISEQHSEFGPFELLILMLLLTGFYKGGNEDA